MGNSSTQIFPSYSWQFANKSAKFDIYQDSRTGIHAEKHVIANNPKISDKDELQLYKYRNQSNKPIVKVYDAEFQKSKGACGANKNIVVYSEYIPYRLSDTRNLSNGQGLYVLSQALVGFQQLHHRFGPFQITDDHIGFNQIGQTKVWHNPNFASNHLDRDSIVLMSTTNPRNFDQRMLARQQEEMVEDIWMAVKQHSMIPPEFSARTNSLKNINFNQARSFINEQIAKGNTYVPQFLNFTGLRGSRNVHASNKNQIYPPQNYQSYQNSGPYLNNAGNQQNNIFGNPNNQNNLQQYQSVLNNTQSNAYPYNSGPQSSIGKQYNQAGVPFANYSTVIEMI